jgi:hypothetical protein
MARYDWADDGIVCASLSGLVVPANAGELSALVLRVASERSATGVLCTVQSAVVALPPIDVGHYRYVAPEWRRLPVAVVVTPEQLAVYHGIAQAGARAGTIRRAFLSADEAWQWLQQQARAVAANRAWWSGRRSLR